MLGGFRQTRLGQMAAEKYGTAGAGLMRQYGTHPEKTRKCPLAVARLQAGRSSRAGLQAGRTVQPLGRTAVEPSGSTITGRHWPPLRRRHRRRIARRRHAHTSTKILIKDAQLHIVDLRCVALTIRYLCIGYLSRKANGTYGIGGAARCSGDRVDTLPDTMLSISSLV